VTKKINDAVLKYLIEKYNCEDTTSSFVDTSVKIKFLSISKNFKDVMGDLDGGDINVNEHLIILLNGVRTIINFEFYGSFDYSNGLIPSDITIKYQKEIDVKTDKQIQILIRDNCKKYQYVANEEYPYYMSNLHSFKEKIVKKK